MGERAVFLDRDGTVIVERDYLADPAEVELIDGVAEALRRLRAAGWKLVVITNQSGIARGKYTVEDFRMVQQRLDQLLQAEGVTFDAVYYCPHHPEFSGPCECRKPGPALYHQAARELGIDLSASAYVGDRGGDVEAAVGFGGRGFLVLTGYGALHRDNLPPCTPVVKDLAGAVDLLLKDES